MMHCSIAALALLHSLPVATYLPDLLLTMYLYQVHVTLQPIDLASLSRPTRTHGMPAHELPCAPLTSTWICYVLAPLMDMV